MSKTYSKARLAYAKERWGIANMARTYFTKYGGDDTLDWKAYRIYKMGCDCRSSSGTSHGGKTKEWFGLLYGENYVDQAYRLAELSLNYCMILGIEFDYYPKGKGGALNSMSVQHNVDGTLDWISNEANALIGDRDASTLHRMATTANQEGNFELGGKLRKCARYVSFFERFAA